MQPALEIDLLIAGLGPGGCVAALAAREEGLSTLAVEARGPEAIRSQLVLVRPGAQAVLRRLGLPDITEGRRSTTIRHVENRLRSAVVDAARPAGVEGGGGPSPLELRWFTSVVGLSVQGDRVRATLRDEQSGLEQAVVARHVIDASGGRLEPLGRPLRSQRGPNHVVINAEFAAPPWFDGIVGLQDANTHDLCLLFPMWGRRGVFAYFDTPPGPCADPAAVVARFQAMAAGLELGPPGQPVEAVDVYQRLLDRPMAGRIVAIGDSVGTVDVLLGAGMSIAIEDGAGAVRSIAAAHRSNVHQAEVDATRRIAGRIFARHRSWAWRGRLILFLRPILKGMFPKVDLRSAKRADVGALPLMWTVIRFVCGKRPQPSVVVVEADAAARERNAPSASP